ncbi:aliphatic sulfonate ABC transporter ATP-binding protein [Cupriavidus sp. UYMU48A]|nr:aliphatic sulfonate ABC transporter ATP-binding protein [Cupriavidus sp. UYMU48A]
MQSNPVEQAALAYADTPLKLVGTKRQAEARPGGVALRVQQVVKRYDGREVLHRIELDAAPGEFVAIVGRSGCGKSTLLRLVAGLELSDEGTITLDAQPARTQQQDIRVMFQDSRLLPWKRVLENVALGLPRERREQAAAVLAQVGLAERAHAWPARLLGRCSVSALRCARARASPPRLLLLDEPLGALDALTRIEMQGLIESLWARLGFTALLVTHDVSEAVALADRIVLIEDGRITMDEPVALARPRQRGSAAFAQLEERVLRRVMQHTPPASSALQVEREPTADWSLLRTVESVRFAV